MAEELAEKQEKESGKKFTKEEVDNKRVTIGNWIREMKAKEADDIYSLGWRRNTSAATKNNNKEQKAERRENCLDKIRPLIDEGASLNRMRKLTGHSAETIKSYMKDAGLWEGYLEKRPELKR